MRLRHTYDVRTPFVRIATTSPTGLWRCRAGKLSTRSWRRYLLSHKKAESEGLLLIRGDFSHLGVTVSSRKAFYAIVEMPRTRPWWSRVRRSSTRLRERLGLGCDGVESNNLLFSHRDASYSVMRKLSQKVFYSAMRNPSRKVFRSAPVASSTLTWRC